jgi:uncharacterized membrane protein
MVIGRLLRHLAVPRWLTRRTFPIASLAAIERAIGQAETTHDGQIKFVVELALDFLPIWRGVSARVRALEVFSLLRIWDTEHNNGVMIYLLLADHKVEIIADRGINSAVNPKAWRKICQTMERGFAEKHYEATAIAGIKAIAELLRRTRPRRPGASNELDDHPVIL